MEVLFYWTINTIINNAGALEAQIKISVFAHEILPKH